MSFRFLIVGIDGITNNGFLQLIIKNFNIFFIFLAPCFYLYFKNLIKSQKSFVAKDLFHFIIPFIFILQGRFSILTNLLNIDFTLVYLFILYMIVTNVLIF